MSPTTSRGVQDLSGDADAKAPLAVMLWTAGGLVLSGVSFLCLASLRHSQIPWLPVESGLFWAGVIGLAGALMILIAGWRGPSAATGGVATPLIALVVGVVTAVMAAVRHWGVTVYEDSLIGAVALGLALTALVVTAFRARHLRRTATSVRLGQ